MFVPVAVHAEKTILVNTRSLRAQLPFHRSPVVHLVSRHAQTGELISKRINENQICLYRSLPLYETTHRILNGQTATTIGESLDCLVDSLQSVDPLQLADTALVRGLLSNDS